MLRADVLDTEWQEKSYLVLLFPSGIMKLYY